MNAPALSSAVVERIVGKALLSRVVEERLLGLFAEGLLHGTVHTCIGQELTGAVVTEFLQAGDTLFSNHRCHGHFLSWTNDAAGLIAELLGRETGVCKGIGGSQHLYSNGFYSNGVQGGIVPVATGLALAHKRMAPRRLSVVFIGDGTLGEGAIYEAFNIAARWELPLLVVLEDNGYAQSTAKEETFAGDILMRAASFGLSTHAGDTWNWQALYGAAEQAVAQVRDTSRPALLYIKTFRLKAHSKGDDNRARQLIAPFEQKDPINALLADPTPSIAKLAEAARARVAVAVDAAKSAAVTDATTLLPVSQPQERASWIRVALEKQRFVHALNQTFHDLMAKDPKVIFFGEDVVSPYGGAFKVAQGLSDKFPDRVLNTPISEAAIVGVANGLALGGFRPVAEIMFGDFLGLAFDQLVNHAAKFEQMYARQVHANVVVRTPMGGGRGYGPTHSQTLDRHFLGVPGLRVYATSILSHPRALYEALLTRDLGASLVLENKLLYGAYLLHEAPQGFVLETARSADATPWTRLRPEAPAFDITLIGYGGVCELLVKAVEALFVEHDIIAQVLSPTQIYPLDLHAVLPVLTDTAALLVVEEGQSFAAFGAELVAELAERNLLPRRVRRLGPAEYCIPAATRLENQFLPSVDAVVRAAVQLCGR